MRPLLASCLVACLLAGPVFAVDLKLPPEVSGQPGAFVTVAAETDGETVVWYPLDAGLNLFPVSLLKDTRTAVVTSPVPGRYRLLAVTAEGGVPTQPVVTTVVIGNAPPVPNPPGPQPPGPQPPPVLTGLAKQVYDRAKAINDPAGAKQLAENYESSLSAIAAGAYAGDFRVAKGKVIADLFAANEPVTAERPAWDAFFQDARGWMNALESSGQLNTLDAVAARLGDIRTGLSEAAK